jgi:hypothetical protein
MINKVESRWFLSFKYPYFKFNFIDINSKDNWFIKFSVTESTIIPFINEINDMNKKMDKKIDIEVLMLQIVDMLKSENFEDEII